MDDDDDDDDEDEMQTLGSGQSRSVKCMRVWTANMTRRGCILLCTIHSADGWQYSQSLRALWQAPYNVACCFDIVAGVDGA